MRAIAIITQAGFAAICGWIAAFLGGLDGLIASLMIFICADYITGVTRAILQKKLSAYKAWRGTCRKVMTFILVGVAFTVDRYVIGGGQFIRDAVIFFFMGSEGISLLENAAGIGLPLPPKLKFILSQLHGERDDKHEKKCEKR